MKKFLLILSRIGEGLIVLLLLIALIGWIGDITAGPGLRKYQKEYLSMIEDFQKTGFKKEQVFKKKKEGNGWDKYSKAIEEIEKLNKEERDVFYKRGTKKLYSSEIFSIINSHKTALGNLSDGAKYSSCIIPYEYEKGYKMPLPNYSNWRILAMLGTASGNMNLLQGRNRQATHDYLATLCYAEDVSGGGLLPIGRMIGGVCSGYALSGIQTGLETDAFNKEDLIFLARGLCSLEKKWPTLNQAIRFDVMSCLLPEITSPFKLIRQSSEGNFLNPFFRWWIIRSISWKDFFSPKRALLGLCKTINEFSSIIKESENKPWEECKEEVESYQQSGHNWLVRMFLPNTTNILGGNRERITLMRLEALAALIRYYKKTNGHFPENLEDIDISEFPKLLIDPITYEGWHYKVFNSDSAVIYSPGIDLVDNGGIKSTRKESDIAIVFTSLCLSEYIKKE
jgi:hypothetical protein